MKVIAINGSPNKGGNTYQALSYMADILKTRAIATEIFHIGNQSIQGCIGCKACFKREAKGCVFDDDVNEIATKILSANGFILGSPNYWGGVSGSFKAFLDRLFFSHYGKIFSGKVAGLAAVTRRSGGVGVIHQLTNYLMMNSAIIAPSCYWALAHGNIEGEVMKDDEGLQVFREQAHNMAWLIKMIDTTKNTIDMPRSETKIRTNFIR
jgi:multimeric flavodoxin WrbA